MRYFNTAGPIRADLHYLVDPLSRMNKTELLSLIDQQKYFVLHAPRQTGKTSSLFALRDVLNTSGNYYCIYINVEDAQAARGNVDEGVRTILYKLSEEKRRTLGTELPFPDWEAILAKSGPFGALEGVLARWSESLDKPLVVLIDEIDSLVGDTLISILRQLRSGYEKRPDGFPQTIVLCGVRDVRDYRIHSEKEKEIITGGSAFNVKSESLNLGNFSSEEIQSLYLQHTQATGQVFEESIFPRVWELTEGQPWLVNALAYEACWKLEKDRTQPITKALIDQAKENMIQRRDTHIDILIDKLSEDRVRRVIDPILSSEEDTVDLNPNDVSYVEDMGLIKREKGKFRISNAIYQEIIPRELTYTTQYTMEQDVLWYLENGKLRMDKLLMKFQGFFRDNSEVWLERFAYKESGPHLLLMAFLQRVINGGGKIDREYGLGMKRIDLLLEYADERFALELKIWHGEKSKQDGLAQLQMYMDKSGAKEGHLILFNRSPNTPWEEKLTHETVSERVSVWGM
jgi:hypothetical protein